MIPTQCRVKHDPENGQYGDCVRACVAAILELSPDAVPHFYHDNPDPRVADERIRRYLDGKGYVVYWAVFDPTVTFVELMDWQAINNPGVHYMLYHSNGENDHVVVCRGGEVACNPAWGASPIIGPSVAGDAWGVMVIALK